MNKKGFVLVETLFMCVFLVVALLLVYNSFIGNLYSEKDRSHYDNFVYLYRTNLMRDFMVKSGVSSYTTEAMLGSSGNKSITCDSFAANKDYCNVLVSEFEISKMFIIRSDGSGVDYRTIPPSSSDYVKRLGTEAGMYRIVIVYNVEQSDDSIVKEIASLPLAG